MALPLFADYLNNSGIKYYDVPDTEAGTEIVLIAHFSDITGKGAGKVRILLDSVLIGTTDENGFCYMKALKKPGEKLLISIEGGPLKKSMNYPIEDDKEFYELYMQLK